MPSPSATTRGSAVGSPPAITKFHPIPRAVVSSRALRTILRVQGVGGDSHTGPVNRFFARECPDEPGCLHTKNPRLDLLQPGAVIANSLSLRVTRIPDLGWR